MKRFKTISIIFISVISAVFCCNIYYLAHLYNSIREDVEREVMTALADTDIDDMWERSEKARSIARANGQGSISQEQADSIYNAEHGTVSGAIDDDGNYVTSTKEEDGRATVRTHTLRRDRSYTNQMVRTMSQQMHMAMDKYYGYNLEITDSILRARLADRQIYPEFVAVEIVSAGDSVLMGNKNLPDGTGGYDVFRLCFAPESGWIYRASISPLTRHILSQMTGVIATIFLLMVSFAVAFRYLYRTVIKLRTIEEMKDDFVSNMTHELKTPIAIAYSANDALLNYDTANDPGKKTAYLNIALKQLRHLGELVEHILAMSMERRRTLALKPETIDLHDFIADIAEAQRMRGDKTISIEVQCGRKVTVHADKSHLSNVINNLIDNAIKYSGDAVAVRITIDGDSIEVADNGTGIPPKCLPFIFDKFYRVPHGNRQDVRGHGIGLYYVKHILGKMDWTITAKSREGHGSTFTIHFNHENKDSLC